jgi:cytochrome c biogenesis protein CcmG, thiol:disulfide interchange protein DsbE
MTARRQLIVAAAVLILVISAISAGRYFLSDELAPVGLGVQAPNFSAMTLDSIPVKKTLADYRGNVVLINIWATWCAPCRVEIPSIEKLNAAYAPKGLKVVAISVDDPGSEPLIRDFVRKYGMNFDVLHDTGGQEGKVSRDYQTTGYPETVIIGRDGVIRRKFLGATDWNSPENRGLIERLLDEKAE